MENNKLFIAGGGGYIGTQLVGQALDSKREVKVFDTFYFGKDKLKRFKGHPGLEVVEGDIRGIEADAFKGCNEVVSLAGISNDPSCDLDPKLTESINRDGCIRLAEKAKEGGVERFVDMSSCSVYGQGLDDVCTEETPNNPVSLYAKMKVQVEDGILPLSSGDFVVSCLRNATTFGPSDRMRFDLVVNIMTMNALLQGIIKVSGDGRQGRPLIHVADVAEACLKMLEADPKAVNGEAFNLVGVNLEIINVAIGVKRALGGDIRIEKFPQDFDIRSYLVDGSKIEKQAGIKPSRTIEDSVREISRGISAGEIVDSPDCYTVKFYKEMKV